MARTLGLVTIGQSPRPDLAEEYARALPEMVIVQAGALDDLSDEAVLTMAPGPDDEVLVTRLRTGRAVRLARRHLEPRLHAALDRVSHSADLTVLLCTGEFTTARPRGAMLVPHRVLRHVAAAVVDGLRGAPTATARVGVLIPDAAQQRTAAARWSDLGEVTIVAASPYRDAAALEAAGRTLRAAEVEVVVMDCIGYTRPMRQTVAGLTGAPTILANASAAMIAREILEGTG